MACHCCDEKTIEPSENGIENVPLFFGFNSNMDSSNEIYVQPTAKKIYKVK